MTPSRTPEALARLGQPLRRAGAAAGGLAALAAGGLALAVPSWLVRIGAVRSPLWVIGAWGLAIVAVIVATVAARWRQRGLAPNRLASTVEAAPGWRRGAVTSLLEPVSAGTSEDLLAAADEACAARLADHGPEALAGVRATTERRRALGAGSALIAVILLALVRPFSGPVAQLWSPAEAWALFRAPVDLRADRATVDRGDSVRFAARAAGRVDARLWLRGKGEAWRQETVALDSAGRATRSSGPLEGDVYAFLESGGRTSDTVAIHVRMPVFLGRLTLTAVYPPYLKMEDEVLPTGGDTLLVPAGTRLKATGEATADLAAASWRGEGGTTPLAVAGREFSGAIVPKKSGSIELVLATRDGALVGGDPVRLPITVVPDLPPVVEVPVPGQDTMPVLGREVALVIDVRDDHGIAAVGLSAVLSRGDRHVVTTALPVPAGANDRAFLSTRLDLSHFGLAAGDTVQYWATARDNAPNGNVGRSRTFVLIVPTVAEARTEQRSATKQTAKRIDSLVAESKKLQRQTEDLSREQTRAQQGDKGDPSMAFEEEKRAEQVARDQQELMDRANQLNDQLEQLEKNSEKAGIGDSAFRQRMDEIRQQLDKALSPEMRKQLEELRQALKNLDPQAAKESLKKLAEMQEKLKEALERTRDLFKRAALEGELSSLQQEAKDVAKQQEDLTDQVGKADSSAVAKEEQQLGERADSVAKGLEQASKQVSKEERKQALQQSAQEAKQAAQNMREASKAAKSGKQREAKQQGENAAQKMKQVEKEVKEQKEDQQQQWRQEVMDALDRALAETARLSQRQLGLSTTIGRGTTLAQSRQDQAVIEEGVQKLVEQVLAVSGKNALVSPQIGASLVAARLQMARARDAISSASANLREATEQSGEAVDALNVAAFQMLRARDEVSGSSSGSGVAEAMKKMQQMAGQQGSLSQEGNNLLSMLAGQQQMQGQMQALARKQRQMAEQLERMRAQNQVPGARDLAEEARELARKLEAGRLDRETVERQERLFKRMLDAGRTLQGEEKDDKKERESVTAKGDSLSVPAPLRRLLDRSGQIRFPTWEDLQRLSPEERRIVTDYFRRLTAKDGR